MKAQLPRSEHYSYQIHRRQVTRQIVLPIALSALLMVGMIALISVSAFKGGGDVGRWAAISTIWIAIPIMLAGIIFLAVLVGLIYLLALLLNSLPHYTGIAQDYVYKARGHVIRGANMVIQPVKALDGFFEGIKEFLGRIAP